MDHCRVGFLQRHMVAHAACFYCALEQSTRVLNADDGDTAEKWLYHKNRKCCYATVITTLPVPKVEVKVEKEKEGGEVNNSNKQEGITLDRRGGDITLIENRYENMK